MLRHRFAAIAALTAGVITGASLARPARAAQSLDCWMTVGRQTCEVRSWGKGGSEIRFSGSATFRFLPAGPPTTANRRMCDDQGTWCRVGDPGQSGRGLWVNRDSLLFPGEAE